MRGPSPEDPLCRIQGRLVEMKGRSLGSQARSLIVKIRISLFFMSVLSVGQVAWAADPVPVPEALLSIRITPDQQKSGFVSVAPVVKRSMESELRRTGTVNFDEEKVSVVSARVGGREVKVLAFEGQKVQKDDPLALVYSPDYTTAEVELLNAFKVQETLRDPSESQAYIKAAQRKLRLLGASQDDVERIASSRKITKYLTLHAPRKGVILNSNLRAGLFMNPGDQLMTIADLSSLLVYMDIYEGDYPLVRQGQQVLLETVAYPGKVFPGQIIYLGGMVDPNTRTFHVRAEIPNPERLLKPGMFASVRIHLDRPRPVAAVPVRAVLRDEHGYHVFVESSPGTFLMRRMVPGREENGWMRVESGLLPGERIAVRGALLLEGIREDNLSRGTGTFSLPSGRIARPLP